MKTLNDFNFKNKKALIRVDFNVPLNNQLEVTDDTRIKSAKPTISKILEDGGSCVLMSHLGRPKNFEDRYSLKHIVNKAEEVLGVEIKFIDNYLGDTMQNLIDDIKPGEMVLLENLRFNPEEKAGDINFAKKLSEWGDIYVNDAFGTAHRAHASTAVIAQFFAQKKCFGYLLQKEIESIKHVIQEGEKPILAILGGAKISSKITIINHILKRVNDLIIGGGMAFTFIKAQGGEVGDSLVEEDKKELALEILKQAQKMNVNIHLPIDVIIADKFSEEANTKTSNINSIPKGWMGLDAGPESINKFEKVIRQSKTILWNGPVGVFEMKPFSCGTIAVGNAVVEATQCGAFSLVGGGDSVAAVKRFGFQNKVSYVSTGGGAMLESLEGKTLPGIAAILN